MELEPQQSKDFERLGIEPPQITSHGVRPEDVREELKAKSHRNWRLEGNILHCDTDFGPFAQTIPTDYILKGTDDDGLPILVKVL